MGHLISEGVSVEGDNMTDDSSRNFIISKLNDLQTEATKEVMRMSFFLNYGGIVATLAAFSNSAFQGYKCRIFICLILFILGLFFAIFMAVELRKFAFDMFSKARAADPANFRSTMDTEIQKHHGKYTVKIFCYLSLGFFALGIIAGIITLFNSL